MHGFILFDFYFLKNKADGCGRWFRTVTPQKKRLIASYMCLRRDQAEVIREIYSTGVDVVISRSLLFTEIALLQIVLFRPLYSDLQAV